MSESAKRVVLLLVAVAVVAIAAFLRPVHQDPAYHRMADTRAVAGVPNGGDVLSNLAFAAVGVAGILALVRPGVLPDAVFADRWVRRPYGLLFAGTALTAVGSGYYHLAPDNSRLFWDRLPMTLGFMGLLTAVLAEHVSGSLAKRLFLPLVLVGAGSVVYWALGERSGGSGDLRPYAAVQFGSMIVILAILVLSRGACLETCSSGLRRRLTRPRRSANPPIGGSSSS